jgi:hypothetical protein
MTSPSAFSPSGILADVTDEQLVSELLRRLKDGQS